VHSPRAADKTFRALGSPRERTPWTVPVRRRDEHSFERARASWRVSAAICSIGVCVLMIELPPLRDRRDDVPLLARHFLVKHARGDAVPRELSAAAERALLAHDWPGNVRELENVSSARSRWRRAGHVHPRTLDWSITCQGRHRRSPT